MEELVVGFLTRQKLQLHQLIGSVFALVKDELKSRAQDLQKHSTSQYAKIHQHFSLTYTRIL